MVNLKELDLSGADITAVGAEYLKSCPRLSGLNLSDNRRLSDDGLACLADLVDLEYLNLRNTGVTSHGLRHLKRLKKLKLLRLDDNVKVADDGVADLCELTSLEDLTLQHTGITSHAVEHLTKLPRLETLDLSENSGITEEVIPYLADLRAVRYLDLHYTRLSSKGAATADSLAPLWRMKSLSLLNLTGTGVNTQRFEAALPNCFVTATHIGAIAPKLTIGVDYDGSSLDLDIREQEKQMRISDKELRDLGVELDRGVSCPDFASTECRRMTAPELLRHTIDRMIALARMDEIDEVFAQMLPIV